MSAGHRMTMHYEDGGHISLDCQCGESIELRGDEADGFWPTPGQAMAAEQGHLREVNPPTTGRPVIPGY